ncbi:MAG: hypothetical protein ACM3L9_07370 [Deltaproteobacteria bacterium]
MTTAAGIVIAVIMGVVMAASLFWGPGVWRRAVHFVDLSRV